ncbi:fungal-specific transcription factor domain-containing protein [Dactylonectria estremocensis]|uniref:Fungal-specific transcription factor domain-containing protein n=1 Tax=Dactylonectria estremocensis TaxID=1079267 RepID=A0A9P9J5N9_9HYPO|nr:fungal-specific transcription factor domain-containing protein [Dactylonectria estremocensis]
MPNLSMRQSPLSDEGEARPTLSTSVGVKRRTKSSQVCDRCRTKKIKCNGFRPCQSCLDKSIPCSYETVTRRTRGSAKERARLLQAQLDHAQMLLKSAGVLDPTLATPDSHPQGKSQTSIGVLLQAADLASAPADLHGDSHNISPDVSGQSQAHGQQSNRQSSCQNESADTVSYLFSPQISTLVGSVQKGHVNSDTLPSTSPGTRETLSSAGCTITSPLGHSSLGTAIQHLNHTNSGSSALFHDHGDVSEVEELTSRYEHHGPTSFLPICVNPGIGWIANKIGNSNYTSSAKSLMSTIGGRLKLSKRLSRDIVEDPDPNTAWEYVRAYFEESALSTFYLANRQSFEERLLRHIENPSASQEDSVWFAMRNIVFATGCRALMSKTHSWTESQSKSGQYFENALRVETDLIHGACRLSATRALLAMSLFSEGGGCQKLEYMLVGCALRLSQSMGLHLRPNIPRISSEEDTKRIWLFWSLYCFEKHLSLRSGRPSTINDDDISCEIPSQAPDGNQNRLEWFLLVIRLAKISSSIIQNFSTARARQQSLLRAVELVQEHEEELKRWYEDVPDLYKQNASAKTIDLPSGILDEHLHYLNLSYHGSLAVVHCIFGHPWNIPGPVEDHDEAVKERIARSLTALANASRDIILSTRSIKVNSMAPGWLLFCYPLIGMINMFICILNSPKSENTLRDISLLEVAAGYFGYLDYASDGAISFPFAASLGTWARQAVSNANAQEEAPLAPNPEPDSTQQMDYGDFNFFNEFGDFAMDQMTLEDWPSFLPRFQ